MASSTTKIATDTPITETITESNIDDIVESLFNRDGELIGYSCKQVIDQNTVEPMDLIFYMDVLSPKTSGGDEEPTNQEKAISEAKAVLLERISQKYQIDPLVSKGVRCFDLPVDGSTWMIQLSIEERDFQEVTIFGGCRELEWDEATQECKFYEGRLKGAYIGAVPKDENGVEFSDVVGVLEKLINGPKIVQNLNDGYETAFLGVPRVGSDPNFQGGDEGRENLKEPVNIKMSIGSNQAVANPNRKTITVVGGLLVGCFSIAFALVGWVLIRRRQSYRRSHQRDLESAADEEPAIVVEGSYAFDKGGGTSDPGDDDLEGTDSGDNEEMHDDEPQTHEPQIPEPQEPVASALEYPNLPMSAEAIQMDLGNTLKGQMMGLHGGETSSKQRSPSRFLRPLASADLYEELDDEQDDVDSWAQTDGTIGSLELQLEPITAEV